MKYLTERDELAKLVKALTFHGDEPFCTTRMIATKFGKKHTEVMDKIEKFESFDAMLRVGKIRPLILEYRGQMFDAYELNADAYAFTCMSFTGKKAEAFKWGILEALKIATLEAVASKATIAANKANDNWNPVRIIGKETNKSFKDSVKTFCQYAEVQRGESYPKNRCPYYFKLTNLTYDALRVKKPKGKKDELSAPILAEVSRLENKMMILIDDVIADEVEYHKAFKRIKQGVKQAVSEEEVQDV